MEAMAASAVVTAAPQTTLVASSVVEPQTTLNPSRVLVPHTTDDPHTTELLATVELPLARVTFPVEELYETEGDRAAPTFDDATSVLAKAA